MANVETNTNRHLRKKYFVDADSVLMRKKSAEPPEPEHFCRIITAQQVHMAGTARKVGAGQDVGKSGKMNVQVTKEGDRIEKIRIDCPCGRHAELDCRYDAAAKPPPAPERPRTPGGPA
jgi:hypothetical protein